VRVLEVVADYQNYIDHPPMQVEQMHQAACSSDTVTVDYWRKAWCDNVRENKKTLGSFAKHSAGKLFGKYLYGSAICAGSGPSLGYNGSFLAKKGQIPLFSCLHNFAFMEDNGINAEFYVSLDAGQVVIPELSAGGKEPAESYWEKTKDKKLVAFIGSHPDLFRKWQGEIYVFTAAIPDKQWDETLAEVEPFHVMVTSGGNVLGACVYIAKAICGVHRVGIVGADYCFGHNKRSFYPWKSELDGQLGQVIPVTDVFGIKCPTWPSYHNFKLHMEWLASIIPGQWMVNCTEGGALGSYPHGNIRAIVQMPLMDFMNQLNFCESIKEACEKPSEPINKILY